MKGKAYLPSFRGFYGSIFEHFDTESEVEHINETRRENGLLNDISDNDVDWNWTDYYKECAKAVANVVCDFLKSEGFVSDIEFIRIVSPKYYNFENDSILCEVEISNENHAKIIEYINSNRDEFSAYISDRFTSRSGFISLYTNDTGEWIEIAKNPSDADVIELQHILDFICNNEGFECDDSAYEYVIGNYQLSANNYDELTKGEAE